MVAEVSAVDHDCSSLDGISVAESDVERQHMEWVEVEGTMAVDMAPIAGRCVLMVTGSVEHVLLPSTIDSVAFKGCLL